MPTSGVADIRSHGRRDAELQEESDGDPAAAPAYKIVHIITRFINGGADENTLLTCNHQVAQGHRVWLVYGKEFRQETLERLDPRVQRIQLPNLVRNVSPVRDLVAFTQCHSLLRGVAPDVVHTHTSKAGILGRLAASLAGTPAIVHGVHILPFLATNAFSRWLYVAMERAAARVTDAFIDVSPSLRQICLDHGIGTKAQHVVAPSGMEVARFKNAPAAADLEELRRSIGEGAVIAGYVAVLEARKRQAELIAAVAKALRERPNVHLVLVGDGSGLAGLTQAAERLAVAGQVHFLGFRADVEEVIAGCDFCVMASKREGLPRVLVQYAAAAKPILSVRLPGAEQLVREGANGYIVEEDDFERFAERFAALASDAALCRRMGAASAALDLSRWEVANMVRTIEAVYATVLRRAPTHGGLASTRQRDCA